MKLARHKWTTERFTRTTVTRLADDAGVRTRRHLSVAEVLTCEAKAVGHGSQRTFHCRDLDVVEDHIVEQAKERLGIVVRILRNENHRRRSIGVVARELGIDDGRYARSLDVNRATFGRQRRNSGLRDVVGKQRYLRKEGATRTFHKNSTTCARDSRLRLGPARAVFGTHRGQSREQCSRSALSA